MPLSTTIAVGSFWDFSVEGLEIPYAIHELKIDFEDGEHVYTSPDLELGVVKTANSRPLMGRFTFHYEYDDADRTITVCGTDYPSEEGMALITMPKDMEEHAYVERTAPLDKLAEDNAKRDSLWNPNSELMPGATDALKRIVRTANQTLIKSLENEPGLTVRIHTPPPKMFAANV